MDYSGCRVAEVSDREAEIREACAAARWADATTAALQLYGDELLGYVAAMTRDPDDADEVFSIFGEMLWKGLPRFRWECSFRTWAYRLARHALGRLRRDPHRRRARPLADSEVAPLLAPLRSRTATFLRSETKDKLAEVRASLPPDDQTLLILRINRKLEWRDIARILDGDGDGEPEPAVLTRRAAALRKRFERLKDELRERLRS